MAQCSSALEISRPDGQGRCEVPVARVLKIPLPAHCYTRLPGCTPGCVLAACPARTAPITRWSCANAAPQSLRGIRSKVGPAPRRPVPSKLDARTPINAPCSRASSAASVVARSDTRWLRWHSATWDSSHAAIRRHADRGRAASGNESGHYFMQSRSVRLPGQGVTPGAGQGIGHLWIAAGHDAPMSPGSCACPGV